jgi:hypothetical protein
MNDPATDHMLCMAVECKSIASKQLLCEVVMKDSGKTERHTIRLCQDHYLKQKAYQYSKDN